MRSTFHALEVARRGLYTQQTAISTTGHNIANANTKGYSRQRVNMTAAHPIDVPGMSRTQTPGQLGTGSAFSSITRIRESFLDAQFRNEAQSHAAWDVRKDTLEKIELIFNEPSEAGLRSVIDDFWNGWQDLSREPDNLTARAAVAEKAHAMIDAFQHADTKLQQLKNDLDENIDANARQANTYIEQIAGLNREIRRIEGHGDNANDLRDQRDVLTDELAKLVEINVEEDPQGVYHIALVDSNQTSVVDGLDYVQLITDRTNPNDINPNLDTVHVNQVTGGEMEGMIDSRDRIVQEYEDHLNEMFSGIIYGEVEIQISGGSILAEDVRYIDENGDEHTHPAGTEVPAGGLTAIVDGMNGLHQLGWTINEDGEGNAIPGGAFFEPPALDPGDSFSIQSVSISQSILEDSGNIAASFRVANEFGPGHNNDDPGAVIVGNGDLALAMGKLRDASFTFEPDSGSTSEGTFDEYFRSVLGVLGVQTQEANRQVSNQRVYMNSIENQRQSVSGVSLDEEMANLIQFQHAYNGSARMMTTIDQMLDTVINRMGIVGR